MAALPALVPLATLRVTIDEAIEVGAVPRGFRRVIPITGGTVAGEELRGEVVPGGADWNLARSDGTASVWARYLIRTHDNVLIGITNSGTLRDATSGVVGTTVVTVEAPEGRYAWLNDAIIVGTLTSWPEGPGVELQFFRFSIS